MIRRTISLLVAGLMIVSLAFPVSVSASNRDTIEKIKSDVSKRTGKKVVVTMKTGLKIKGLISNVLDDSFDLLDVKTRQASTLLYSDVEKVKKQGWSSGAKVALGIAIGAGVVTAVVFGGLAGKPLDGFCPLGC